MSRPTLITDPPTPDHERLLLACALTDADAARELLATVLPPMISDPGLSRAWSALGRVLEATTGPVDLVDALSAELAGEADAPSLIDLHALTTAVPSAANAAYYAGRVREAYARREAVGMIGEIEAERTREMATNDLLLGIEARARRLRELTAGVVDLLRSAADFADVPQPVPVLWRDPGGADAHEAEHADAVLSVGEVALLASAGGLGKSTVTLEIASVAVDAADLGAPFGAACGLRVAPGPVVLVSYEDAPTRIAHRLRWMNAGDVPGGVHLWPDPAPMWQADAARGGESRPGDRWPDLWHGVRNLGARLVVIDPVSAALADVSTTETSPVRCFLRALTIEAEAAGCGVLLVCHSNKAGRNALARGEDPGAGVVAGSAAWFDGARGVLSLMPDPAGGDGRLLEAIKCNYGRTGWGARLIERRGAAGAYRGLELGVRMERDALTAAKRPLRKDAEHATNGVSNPYA